MRGGETVRCEIIYEDEEILIVHKPAGLATQSANLAEMDVVSELKNYLAGKNRGVEGTKPAARSGVEGTKQAARRGAKGVKPAAGQGAAPYVGIVHRLDQPVEGLLAFAKTKAAAAALTRQLGNGTLNKTYLAAVFGDPLPKGELLDMIRKEKNVAQVVTGREGEFSDAKQAKLCYERLDAKAVLPGTALLKVQIETGRFHQIRAQLSHAGFPILGDAKYGSEASKAFSKEKGIRNLTLCANELTLTHPRTKREYSWNCTPAWLSELFVE